MVPKSHDLRTANTAYKIVETLIHLPNIFSEKYRAESNGFVGYSSETSLQMFRDSKLKKDNDQINYLGDVLELEFASLDNLHQ